MEKKDLTSFSMDKAIGRITKTSVFDRIVKEIDAREIPTRYVEQVVVQYHDGNVIELKGDELTHPIPVNRNAKWETLEGSFKKMKDVKIYINTEKLEIDINAMVEDYLGKYC